MSAASEAAPSRAVAERLRRLVPREFARRMLATRGQTARERRVVTMLFSDVKGSTPMAAKLDPEEYAEIMDGALDVLIEPITRYEGALARSMGDGILAFFGAPVAHEDDAERACRAALEIIEGAGGYAAHLEREWGIEGFNVRVGIHTGLVVVGETGSDLRVEYTAMGDAVNIASRMETAAEPGTVLITQETYRLIAPLFETKALGPLQVKGRAGSISVHRVLARRAVAAKPRGIAGLASPLVGRESEFGALLEALEHLQEGVGGFISIVGEAGIGKSRLVAELRKSAEPHDLSWVEGRCLSYGDSIAYLPWQDILYGLLGGPVGGSAASVRDEVRRAVQDLCPDNCDEVYPYLARMLSLPLEDDVADMLQGTEPEGLKALTFRAVERVVECVTRVRPLVLVCEDLHWADPSSLELVEHLLGLADRTSLLLVCAFRPYREQACWQLREAADRLYPHRHIDLNLAPLSAADSARLVSNLLEVEALPRPLRERIHDHTEGNPFYVEEVIRSLIDAGAIVQDEVTGYWQAMRGVEDIAIPDTLHGVLMARIDRLDDESRRVLQLASVIGRVFPFRVLSAIAIGEGDHLEPDRRGLVGCLSTLQREEMIREQARVPELEYTFKHHLTQEAAYNSLLRRERRRCHRRVAEALEQLFAERIEEQLGLVAHHWEQAGERDRAIDHLYRAGRWTAAQFANEEAIGYFSRALDLAQRDDLIGRYELLLAREEVYRVLAAGEDQGEDLSALQELAEVMDDDNRRAEVALRQAAYAHRLPDYASEMAAAQKAVHLARATGDGRIQAAGYRAWASALHVQGDYGAAHAKLQQALALARANGLRREQARCLFRLGGLSKSMGEDATCAAHLEDSRRLYEEVGDRWRESEARLFLALALIPQGYYDEGRAHIEQAVVVFREVGDRWRGALAHLIPAAVHHALGEYGAAKPYYDRYLTSSRDNGDERGVAYALGYLGLLSHHLGDDRTALDLTQQAVRMLHDQGDRGFRCAVLTYLGHALAGLARWDEAVEAYRRAVGVRRELGQSRHATEALAGLARVRLAQGDLTQALGCVEEILCCAELRASGGFFILSEPVRSYLTCYRALRANLDPRAGHILEQGYRFLQERAAKISDEDERRSFLESVAAHREIVAEYAATG